MVFKMSKREEWLKKKRVNYENSISSITKELLKPALKYNSKIEADILLNWDNIISNELRQIVSLKKISYVNKKSEFIKLYITTLPENSVEVSYKKDLIIERVNFFFGKEVVQDVIVEKII